MMLWTLYEQTRHVAEMKDSLPYIVYLFDDLWNRLPLHMLVLTLSVHL